MCQLPSRCRRTGLYNAIVQNVRLSCNDSVSRGTRLPESPETPSAASSTAFGVPAGAMHLIGQRSTSEALRTNRERCTLSADKPPEGKSLNLRQTRRGDRVWLLPCR
jgi:hypothetical protein